VQPGSEIAPPYATAFPVAAGPHSDGWSLAHPNIAATPCHPQSCSPSSRARYRAVVSRRPHNLLSPLLLLCSIPFSTCVVTWSLYYQMEAGSYKRNHASQSPPSGRIKLTQSTINLATATLEEMSLLLADRLEGLRRSHNQRIPEHVAHPKRCVCQLSGYTGFDRDWTPAEPHIET